MFDLVVWDFDGVLNRNIVDGRFIWADTVKTDWGIDPEALQSFVFKSGVIRDVIAGQTDILHVLSDFFDAMSVDTSVEEFWAYWLEKDALPDAEVLSWLKASKARHVIGTNNETRRSTFIRENMGYARHVERLFSSGEMHLAKPDPRYFEKITEWAEVEPKRTLLIDDSLPNVEAAQNLGWEGFHFTDETRALLPSALGIT